MKLWNFLKLLSILLIFILFIPKASFSEILAERNWNINLGLEGGGYKEIFDLDDDILQFHTGPGIRLCTEFLYNNFTIGVSYLHAEPKFEYNMNGSDEIEDEWTITNIDFYLEYKINEYFEIFSGYSNESTSFEGKLSDTGSKVMHGGWRAQGLKIGVGTFYPTDSGFKPYFIATLLPHVEYKSSVRHNMATAWFGWSTDIGLEYSFPNYGWTVAGGYLYKYIYMEDNSKDLSIKTEFIHLGISYSF